MRHHREIPSIADYAHWNEDAELMWYQESRYDMEYGFDEYDYDEPYDFDPYDIDGPEYGD